MKQKLSTRILEKRPKLDIVLLISVHYHPFCTPIEKRQQRKTEHELRNKQWSIKNHLHSPAKFTLRRVGEWVVVSQACAYFDHVEALSKGPIRFASSETDLHKFLIYNPSRRVG